MMTREMMEEIFEGYCVRYDMDWYEVFDGDLLDVLLDRDPVFAEWYEEMAGDL